MDADPAGAAEARAHVLLSRLPILGKWEGAKWERPMWERAKWERAKWERAKWERAEWERRIRRSCGARMYCSRGCQYMAHPMAAWLSPGGRGHPTAA